MYSCNLSLLTVRACHVIFYKDVASNSGYAKCFFDGADIAEGWAEVVKCGIILDAQLFALFEAHAAVLRDFQPPPVDLLCQIISRSIELKVSVIEKDEREQHLRAILNDGHTYDLAVA